MTVYGLEKEGRIQDIEIEKHVNQHSVCRVSLLLNEERQLFGLQDLIGREMVVEDDVRIFMRGTVESVSGRTAYSKTTALVTLISFSSQSDKESCSRIFQDTEKTYGDVFHVLEGAHMRVQVVNGDFARLKEPKTLVQYGETDFAFAVRTAGEKGYGVFVNDTDTTCMLNIGRWIGETGRIVKSRDILSLSWDLNRHEESLKIRLRTYYEPGSLLNVEGRDYVAVSLKILFHNGESDYDYVLVRESVFGKADQGERRTFPLGLAKVAANEDPENLGRIQAEFLDFQDSLPANKTWITYLPLLTEGQGGQVFIPDPGEMVHIFAEDGNCYADGCVRRTAMAEAFQDVKERSFGVRNQSLAFTDRGIQVKSFGYEFVVEENGFHAAGQGVKIDAGKESLYIECGDVRLRLDVQKAGLEAASDIRVRGKRIDAQSQEIYLAGGKIRAKTDDFQIN